MRKGLDVCAQMQKNAPIDARTCKHLAELLSKQYEDARLRAKGVEPAQAKKTTKKSAKRRKPDSEDEPAASAAVETTSPAKKPRVTEEKVRAGFYFAKRMACLKLWGLHACAGRRQGPPG